MYKNDLLNACAVLALIAKHYPNIDLSEFDKPDLFQVGKLCEKLGFNVKLTDLWLCPRKKILVIIAQNKIQSLLMKNSHVIK